MNHSIFMKLHIDYWMYPQSIKCARVVAIQRLIDLGATIRSVPSWKFHRVMVLLCRAASQRDISIISCMLRVTRMSMSSPIEHITHVLLRQTARSLVPGEQRYAFKFASAAATEIAAKVAVDNWSTWSKQFNAYWLSKCLKDHCGHESSNTSTAYSWIGITTDIISPAKSR